MGQNSQTSGGGSLTDRLPELNKKNVAKAVGVAAAVVAGTIGVRAYRRNSTSSTEESIFHLRQDGDQWILELEGSSSPEGTFGTKQEGLDAARELAHKSAPCELVVYRTDGSIQDRHTYEQ